MMQFDDDRYWRDIKDFLQTYLQSEEPLLAPVPFKDVFQNVYSYDMSYVMDVNQFVWVLLHKGKLHSLSLVFLKQVAASFNLVLANDVFILFTNRVDVPAREIRAAHLQPLWEVVTLPDSWKKETFYPAKRVMNALRRLKKRGLSRSLSSNEQTQEISGKLSVVLERLVRMEQSVQHLEQRLQIQHQTQKHIQQRGRLLHNSTDIATLSASEFNETCYAASQVVYLGENLVLCRVLAKYFLYAETQDVGIVPHLCLDGYWETWLTLAMARVLQPGWTCIDVGANHGYYTLLMAGIVGPSGRVAAIEPTPRLVHLLQQTLDVNGLQHWTTIVPAAAYDRPGKMNLVIPKGFGMNASVKRPITSADDVVEVETFTIDQLTRDWPVIHFIKIDAEGAEEHIWNGMQETIDRHPNLIIILEFACVRYADPQAFLQAIQAKGFPLRHIDFDAQIQDLTLEQCLNDRPQQDWLLFLQRTG